MIAGERKAAMKHCRAAAHALFIAAKENKRVPRAVLDRAQALLDDFEGLLELEEANEKTTILAYIASGNP